MQPLITGNENFLSGNPISYKPIGVIHSGFKKPEGTPIQPVAEPESLATVEVFPAFSEGLMDVEGFSLLILIYHMHLVERTNLVIIPFLDSEKHGVFATRAPGRPNPIGFSVVELEKRVENILFIKGVDILDGTPLLDIKPFIPAFDIRKATKTGWLKNNDIKISIIKDDGRFCNPDEPGRNDPTL